MAISFDDLADRYGRIKLFPVGEMLYRDPRWHPVLQEVDGVMLNAVQVKTREDISLPENWEGILILDNGIFGGTVLKVDELVERTNTISPEIVCGPDVLYAEDTHLKSLERQKRFLKAKLPSETSVMLIPQGNTCEQYEWCIGECLKLNPDYLGLGRMSIKLAGYPGKSYSQRIFALQHLEESGILDKIKEQDIRMHALGLSSPYEFKYFNHYGFWSVDSIGYLFSSLFHELHWPEDLQERKFHIRQGEIQTFGDEDEEIKKRRLEFVKDYPFAEHQSVRAYWIMRKIWKPLASMKASQEEVSQRISGLQWEDRDDTPILEKPHTKKAEMENEELTDAITLLQDHDVVIPEELQQKQYPRLFVATCDNVTTNLTHGFPKEIFVSERIKHFIKFCEHYSLPYGILSGKYGLWPFDLKADTYDHWPGPTVEFYRKLAAKVQQYGIKELIWYNVPPREPGSDFFKLMQQLPCKVTPFYNVREIEGWIKSGKDITQEPLYPEKRKEEWTDVDLVDEFTEVLREEAKLAQLSSEESPSSDEPQSAPVLPSGEEIGEEISLDDILQHFKSFKIAQPLVYLTGGIVNNEKTTGDIDIFIRTVKDDPIVIPIQFRILRMLPEELRDRVQFLFEDMTEGKHVPGPYTSFVPLFSLEAMTIDPFERVEMSSEVIKGELQRIVPGKFFTPLKPTIGYKKGEAFGFEALKELVNFEHYPVVVQKKYDGARLQMHKDRQAVKIYSDGKQDVTHRLPSFVEAVKSSGWPQSFIMDIESETWKDSDHQPREVTSGYLREKAPAQEGDDKNFVLNVFDVLFMEGEDLHAKPYSERLKFLDKLPIEQSTDEVPRTGTFNKTPSYEATNDDEMVKHATRVSERPGSEGAMVKALASPYPLTGTTDMWYKYKKTVVFRVAALERLTTKTPGVFNYRMGILTSDGFDIIKEDLRKVGDTIYIYVGKTLNSKINVKPGTTLRVTAENVFLYQKNKRIRLYIPVLIEAEPKESADNAATVVRIAKDSDLLEEKETLDVTEEVQEITLQQWPDAGEKDYPFVVQVHFRGKSAHHDFRTSFDGHLEGWTIFSQPEGVIKEEPSTLEEARALVNSVKWKWPKESKAQVTSKSRQPKAWLEVEGKFDPGTVGATREKSGFMTIADKGTLRYGARKTWFYEYFLNGSKIKGRLIFRQIGRPGERRVGFWVSWLPEDKTPYVLGKEALKDEWVPPQGWSALPPDIKAKVPSRLRYWEHASRATRVKLRDELADLLKTRMQKLQDLPNGKKLGKCTHCGDHVCPGLNMVYASDEDEPELGSLNPGELKPATLAETKDFFLLHHFWKGPKVIRAGPSVQHWDLFIPPDLQIILDKNPIDSASSALTAKPYKKDFWSKGARNAESIRPGHPGNPTPDTPAWVQRLDSGKVKILESTNMVKRYIFQGKKLQGSFILEREDPNSNLWMFSKAEHPGEKLELSEGEYAQMYLAVSSVTAGEDSVDITGTAFSYGTWNGVYYPPGVVADRPDRMIGIPVVLGGHRARVTAGKVMSIKETDSDIEIVTRIEGADNVNFVKDLKAKGQLEGFSVEIIALIDRERGIAKRILEYERVAIVPDPACKVCKIIDVKTT